MVRLRDISPVPLGLLVYAAVLVWPFGLFVAFSAVGPPTIDLVGEIVSALVYVLPVSLLSGAFLSPYIVAHARGPSPESRVPVWSAFTLAFAAHWALAWSGFWLWTVANPDAEGLSVLGGLVAAMAFSVLVVPAAALVVLGRRIGTAHGASDAYDAAAAGQRAGRPSPTHACALGVMAAAGLLVSFRLLLAALHVPALLDADPAAFANVDRFLLLASWLVPPLAAGLAVGWSDPAMPRPRRVSLAAAAFAMAYVLALLGASAARAAGLELFAVGAAGWPNAVEVFLVTAPVWLAAAIVGLAVGAPGQPKNTYTTL